MSNTNNSTRPTKSAGIEDYRIWRQFAGGLIEIGQFEFERFGEDDARNILNAVQLVCKEYGLSMYERHFKYATTGMDVFIALKRSREDAEMTIHMLQGGTLD